MLGLCVSVSLMQHVRTFWPLNSLMFFSAAQRDYMRSKWTMLLCDWATRCFTFKGQCQNYYFAVSTSRPAAWNTNMSQSLMFLCASGLLIVINDAFLKFFQPFNELSTSRPHAQERAPISSIFYIKMHQEVFTCWVRQVRSTFEIVYEQYSCLVAGWFLARYVWYCRSDWAAGGQAMLAKLTTLISAPLSVWW